MGLNAGLSEEAAEKFAKAALFTVGVIIPIAALILAAVSDHHKGWQPNYDQPERPSGSDKTSSIKDTGVGPVRVDVAAYFANQRAANTAHFG